MSRWRATRASRVLAALRRLGWTVKREAKSSHKVLAREGFPDFVWAFHDRDEIGPRMLARIAKDGRRHQPRRAGALAEVIRAWMELHRGGRRTSGSSTVTGHSEAFFRCPTRLV